MYEKEKAVMEKVLKITSLAAATIVATASIVIGLRDLQEIAAIRTGMLLVAIGISGSIIAGYLFFRSCRR